MDTKACEASKYVCSRRTTAARGARSPTPSRPMNEPGLAMMIWPCRARVSVMPSPREHKAEPRFVSCESDEVGVDKVDNAKVCFVALRRVQCCKFDAVRILPRDSAVSNKLVKCLHVLFKLCPVEGHDENRGLPAAHRRDPVIAEDLENLCETPLAASTMMRSGR